MERKFKADFDKLSSTSLQSAEILFPHTQRKFAPTSCLHWGIRTLVEPKKSFSASMDDSWKRDSFHTFIFVAFDRQPLS